MSKKIKILILLFILLSSFSADVYAMDTIGINELIEKAKELDGKEVTIQGEAIGERMDRGEYSWVNINDGTNAIGIWIKKDQVKNITYYGNYKYKGDTLKITGIFNRACDEHGGEADVHANSIEIVKDGYPVKKRISLTKTIIAIVLIIVVLLYIYFFIKAIKKTNY